MSDPKPMAVVITSGRDYEDRDHVYNALDALQRKRGEVYVISDMSPGAGASAHAWAQMRRQICREFRAKWHLHDIEEAGRLRNRDMLSELHRMKKQGYDIGVVAFPGGDETAHMCALADEYRITVWRPAR